MFSEDIGQKELNKENCLLQSQDRGHRAEVWEDFGEAAASANKQDLMLPTISGGTQYPSTVRAISQHLWRNSGLAGRESQNQSGLGWKDLKEHLLSNWCDAREEKLTLNLGVKRDSMLGGQIFGGKYFLLVFCFGELQWIKPSLWAPFYC